MTLELVDTETGEIDELAVFDEEAERVPVAPIPRQMSLDVALFATYHVPEVQVSVTFSQKMSLEELRRITDGAALFPSSPLWVEMYGYVAGAGLKWKADGEGRSATLSIVGDKLDNIVINPVREEE